MFRAKKYKKYNSGTKRQFPGAFLTPNDVV